MDRAADEVARGRALAPATRAADARPLLTLVEQTAKQGGLTTALKRVEPQGADRARVWLEQANFDALVRWLADIQKRMAIYVESAVVDPQKEAGMVNARLVLRRGDGG
jgi:type II secretory pathway component PulM